MENFEVILLAELMNKKRKGFVRTVLPHLKPELFSDFVYSEIFKEIKSYIREYKKLPPLYVIRKKLESNPKIQSEINQNTLSSFFSEVDEILKYEEEFSDDWLTEEAERFCKEKSLYNAIINAVEDIENNKIKISGNVIEQLQKAMGFSFDQSIGIELTDEKDAKKRFDLYKEKIEHFSTGIEKLDLLTNGGFEPKSLTLFLAPTGVGKSNVLVYLGSNYLRQGKNVLYITLEMSEEKIAQRFDANFLQVPINEISDLSKEEYMKIVKTKLLDLNGRGRLFIKEYPPASITVDHIRALLDELKLKSDFTPDIILIDYIQLMNSNRVKNDNMYSIGKAISEEVRGLAIENDFCIISAIQSNRKGFGSSDLNYDDVSESIGAAYTVDCMIGIIMTSELREQNIQLFKMMKNRFGHIIDYSFPVKVNFEIASLMDNDDDNYVKGINETKVVEDVSKLELSKKKTNKIKIDLTEDDEDLLNSLDEDL